MIRELSREKEEKEEEEKEKARGTRRQFKQGVVIEKGILGNAGGEKGG